MDLRGYGESDKPQRVSDYELLTLVNDIKEVVEALGKVSSGIAIVPAFCYILYAVYI